MTTRGGEVGWRWEGGSGGRGHFCTLWLIYAAAWQNSKTIVKQLFSN